MKLFTILIFTLLFPTQQEDQITGIVLNEEDNSPLSAVTVLVDGTNLGTVSEESGSFVLPKLETGNYEVIFRSLGFETKTIQVSIPEDLDRELEVMLRPSISELDELTVVSSILRTGANYQPQQVFNRRELENRADIGIGQMLDGEPGISMRSFGSVPSRPVVRGFDGERLLILENGERMGDVSESAVDHAIALDPAATESIEVIRGPSGLLFGNNALGGVVNLVTSDIPQSFTPGLSGNTTLQGASVNGLLHGYSRLNYGWNNHAVTGRFSYREAGDVQTPDGRLPQTSMSALEGSLGWGFGNERTQGGFSIMGMDHTYQIPEGIEDPDEQVEIRYNRQGIQGQLRHKTNHFFDQIQIRLHASRYDHKEIEIDFFPDGTTDEDIEIDYLQWAYSSTITAEHKEFGVFNRGTVGLNLSGRHFTIGGEEAYAPGDITFNPALFTLQETNLTDLLTLQLGARLDYRYVETIPNELNEIEASASDADVSAAVGLNYEWGPRFTAGFQLARSHRYPTIEELYADGAHLAAGVYEIGDETLETERTLGADVFGRWNYSNLFIELAGFYSYIQNFVAFQPQGFNDEDSGLPVFVYTGDQAQIMGGEFTAVYNMNERISTELGLDYVHGTRLNDNLDPLPFMPPFRSRIVMNYDFGQGSLAATVRYISAQNRVAPGEDTTDGYVLAGLRVNYRLGSRDVHNLTLRVDNLFNTSYRDHLSRIEDRNFPMPGRNMMLGYSWVF